MECSARSARDSIAFAESESNELKLMRLSSISQAVFTEDSKLAASLIGRSDFSSSLLHIVDGCPALRDSSAFEEAFAEAKRQHIDKERQEIIKDFPTNLIVSPRKSLS